MEASSLQMTEPLFLAPRHRELLLTLLHQYLPDRTVWAFGSRATGKYLGRFSDLDLAVATRLPDGVKGELLGALDESDLPIQIDLVELDTVEGGFADRIRPDMVVVCGGQEAGSLSI